jgi:hypothetical protein
MTDGEQGMADEPGDEPPTQEPKCDQRFFLKLAREGKKDAWNKWRRAHKGVPVTFAGVDFSEEPWDEIDFSGFEFGDNANFWGCKWRGVKLEERGHLKAFGSGRPCFTGAVFGKGGRLHRRGLRRLGHVHPRGLRWLGQLLRRDLR